ncbi:MAG: hypothetical protein JOZ18_19485, partial [Chloroflexi bacterium]|nr:hypothetical protein [Chloroflexota bacterium]
IMSFTGSHRYIVDYLLEEVMSRQSEDIQHFLLSTAILSRLNASLCPSILGNHMEQEELCQQSPASSCASSRQCQEMLEYLERTSLFLIPLDQEQHWYRYHRLFGEALLARLLQLYPSQVVLFHPIISSFFDLLYHLISICFPADGLI